MGENGSLEFEASSGIGSITFGHPKGNSLPGALLSKIASQIEAYSQDDDVRVILLKSVGEKAFCAGASFAEFLAVSNLDESKAFFGGFAKVITAIRKSPKIVVSRVQGKVVGGGVGIVSASDYAIATEAAAAKLSEIALGIGPFIIGPAVERKIGLNNFAAMGIDADWREASWCAEVGLYSKVVADIPALDSAVSEMLAKLAGFNPAAMANLKQVLWQGTESWDSLLAERVGITAELALTDFVQSTIQGLQAR